jgi:hypothetical protein
MSQQEASRVVFFLAKFGRLAHLEQLQRGNVYMKTLGYFRKLDASRGWGDPWEGMTAHLQPQTTRLFVRTEVKTWALPLASPVLLHNFGYEQHHLLCLASVHDEHAEAFFERGAPVFSPKFFENDDEKSHVLLLQVRPFLERLSQGASAAGKSFLKGLVTYFDGESFDGELSPFHKNSALKWQQEFRVLFEPSGGETLTLQIQSLEDISVIVPARDVNQCFEFRRNEEGIDESRSREIVQQ